MNQNDLTLEDLYFKDAFTKTGDQLNLEVNELTIDSLISKNNKFSLDEDGNLSVNSIMTNTGFNQQICDLIYPVGAIYLSVQKTSPSTLFGGTWVPLKDRFLLGAGDTYPAGTTGGEASHTLTIEEMPEHSHDLQVYDYNGPKLDWVLDNVNKTAKYNDRGRIKNTGGSKAHNTMPPYITVYMWQRTA